VEASELDYDLPEELIAQQPPAERDAARMLVLDRCSGEIAHRTIRDLPRLLEPSLFVLNETRVLPARLRGYKPSGGRVELLLVERLGPAGSEERWLAMGRASRPLRPGTSIALGPELTARVVGQSEQGRVEVLLSTDGRDVHSALEQVGEMPLPPYIRRPSDERDRERYQTVFASEPGAVAAPTAGLHLSERLMGELQAAGHRMARITLHVGPGTFQPLQGERLEEHRMHSERYVIAEPAAEAIAEARREGRPVVAVGTTVVRTLESEAREDGTVEPTSGATSLFIYPPWRFRVVDTLLTNFHLPRSTLLALVMAFGGTDAVRRSYAEAVRARYRFFSYGDAMLIRGRPR
jgi:S-adenosylmethionine:tRNA ribosyltransferase-isomerase